jgi:hypothetical protein
LFEEASGSCRRGLHLGMRIAEFEIEQNIGKGSDQK